jgi:hypothetical protein
MSAVEPFSLRKRCRFSRRACHQRRGKKHCMHCTALHALHSIACIAQHCSAMQSVAVQCRLVGLQLQCCNARSGCGPTVKSGVKWQKSEVKGQESGVTGQVRGQGSRQRRVRQTVCGRRAVRRPGGCERSPSPCRPEIGIALTGDRSWTASRSPVNSNAAPQAGNFPSLPRRATSPSRDACRRPAACSPSRLSGPRRYCWCWYPGSFGGR